MMTAFLPAYRPDSRRTTFPPFMIFPMLGTGTPDAKLGENVDNGIGQPTHHGEPLSAEDQGPHLV